MNADYNPQLGKRRTLFPDREDYLVNVEYIQEQGDGLVLMVRTAQDRSAAVRAEFLTDSAVRLKMFTFPEEKERNAVFDFDSIQAEHGNAGIRRPHAEIRPTDKPGHIVYGNDDIQLSFRTDFWEMSVSQRGKEILRDQSFDTNVDNRWKVLPAGFTFSAQDVDRAAPVRARMNLLLRSDEAIWGLGEKFTSLNKRGQRIHCWQRDALSTNTEDAYKSHPFYISSYGYGLLLNTYARSCFDIGCASQVSLQISAEDTLLDVILFLDPGVEAGLNEELPGNPGYGQEWEKAAERNGANEEGQDRENEAERQFKEGQGHSGFVARILSSYVRMTGGIPLIPKWAFGYWQSKCSYLCRKQVEEVAADAAKYNVPLDVIHLDSWQKKENAGTWEWNTEAYPRPEEMIDNLHDKGIHLSIWNYPYVSENSPEFRKIETCGYFIRNEEGNTALFRAMADADDLVACFDFTNPDCTVWYKDRIKRALRSGADVIKTDFSEAVPENARLYDGTTGVESHNKIPFLYAKTVYEAMAEYFAEEGKGRIPMLWGRSGFAGSHRYPAAWAGDSCSSCTNHAAILRGGLSLALSGVAYWGFDLGGFYNTDSHGDECMPSEEEYLRSFELGMFMPLARAHGKTPREPWHYSAHVLETARRYDEVRHELEPYLYHCAVEAHLFGKPILRPLLYEFPDDLTAAGIDLEYMLGQGFLVAPPFDRKSYPVWLPEGCWTDFWTGNAVQGGRWITAEPDLDTLPVFVREGTLLPLQASDSRVTDAPFIVREVRIYQGGTAHTAGPADGFWYDTDESGKILRRRAEG